MSEKLEIKLTTLNKIVVVSYDDFFVDEKNNYVDRYRVDIYENEKGEKGDLIDCETGFMSFEDALKSSIEYLGELLTIEIFVIIQDLTQKKDWYSELKKQLHFDIQQRDLDAISRMIRRLKRRLKKECMAA